VSGETTLLPASRLFPSSRRFLPWLPRPIRASSDHNREWEASFCGSHNGYSISNKFDPAKLLARLIPRYWSQGRWFSCRRQHVTLRLRGGWRAKIQPWNAVRTSRRITPTWINNLSTAETKIDASQGWIFVTRFSVCLRFIRITNRVWILWNLVKISFSFEKNAQASRDKSLDHCYLILMKRACAYNKYAHEKILKHSRLLCRARFKCDYTNAIIRLIYSMAQNAVTDAIKILMASPHATRPSCPDRVESRKNPCPDERVARSRYACVWQKRYISIMDFG